MGQQQLLLLVLGIVIVGLAVVVGIQAFGENQKKNNLDAMTQDAVRIATAVQAWKMKPAANGGGAAATTFTGATFAQLGFLPTTGTGANATYETQSGTFRIKPFEVTGQIAALARQMFGITNTGDAVAVVGMSRDRTQSVLVGIFMVDPTKTITFLQHPYNTTVYDS
jgi:hypothetical protein